MRALLFLVLLTGATSLAASVTDFAARRAQAMTLEKNGQRAAARPWLEETLQLALTETGPTSTETLLTWQALALLAQRQNDFPRAGEALRQILAIQEKRQGPDHPAIATALYDVGWFYSNLGNYAQAQMFFEKALALRQRKGRKNLATAESLNSLGVLHENQGHSEIAERYYLEALEIQTALLGRNSVTTATTINNLATLYWSRDDYSQAEQYFTEALKIRERLRGPTALVTATSLNNLALLYGSLGDYRRAEQLFRRVLTIREKRLGEDHPFTLTTVHQLGLLYVEQQQYEKARPLLVRAAKQREQILGEEHPDTARSLFHLAWFYDRTGEYDKASPLHLRALAIRRKLLGETHPETTGSLSFLARHYHLIGDLTQARPLYLQAWTAEKAAGSEFSTAALQILENLSAAERDLGQTQEALKYARLALTVREKLVQNSFGFTSEAQRIDFQRTLKPYNLAATLGSTPDLARAIFRMKGVVLDSLLEDQAVARSSHDPEVRRLQERLQLVSYQLREAQMQTAPEKSPAPAIDQLQKEEWELQAEYARKLTSGGSVRRALQVEPSQIAARIPAGSILIEWIRYEEIQRHLQSVPSYGALLVLPGNRYQWIPLGPAAEIDQLIHRYQKCLRRRVGPAAIEKVLREGYDKLWQPLASALPPGTRHLILSPDAELNFVSFATLVDQSNQFLGEHHTLTYVSSGRDLLRNSAPPPSPRHLVIFANPAFSLGAPVAGPAANRTFGEVRLPALPGTKQEADFLQQHSGAWGLASKTFSGADASESALRQIHSPWILHLGTHGLLLPPGQPGDGAKLLNPMQRSVLAMAGAQKTLQAWDAGRLVSPENDGVVTAQEIAALDLTGSWLVVLSACDTGSGEAQAGEGVLGLRRGFISAGAQQVLLTLWPVSDAQTALFMEGFYQKALPSGKVREAFADAQRESLSKLRETEGLGVAAKLAGAFILSF